MRYRPILPAAAGALAAVHVLGILTGVPLLRQAEVAALLLLLAYALTARLPVRPAWRLPPPCSCRSHSPSAHSC
ncbi:hypothetical protein [Micromonospora sp. CP22]|uniref:hypothetical protein n=1 Tax=Micromonospora sp. CP22 TaxID=2580517 RepID=UPI0018AD1D3D|nr:hypothetical protein [Micromonospora sp. CP22]